MWGAGESGWDRGLAPGKSHRREDGPGANRTCAQEFLAEGGPEPKQASGRSDQWASSWDGLHRC